MHLYNFLSKKKLKYTYTHMNIYLQKVWVKPTPTDLPVQFVFFRTRHICRSSPTSTSCSTCSAALKHRLSLALSQIPVLLYSAQHFSVGPSSKAFTPLLFLFFVLSRHVFFSARPRLNQLDQDESERPRDRRAGRSRLRDVQAQLTMCACIAVRVCGTKISEENAECRLFSGY